jgi:hypothetical protein
LLFVDEEALKNSQKKLHEEKTAGLKMREDFAENKECIKGLKKDLEAIQQVGPSAIFSSLLSCLRLWTFLVNTRVTTSPSLLLGSGRWLTSRCIAEREGGGGGV